MYKIQTPHRHLAGDKMADAESDLAELRKIYGGRKDIITPSVFSRLSPERQQQVMDEMLAEARRAGIRRTKLYQKLAKEMH